MVGTELVMYLRVPGGQFSSSLFLFNLCYSSIRNCLACVNVYVVVFFLHAVLLNFARVCQWCIALVSIVVSVLHDICSAMPRTRVQLCVSASV